MNKTALHALILDALANDLAIAQAALKASHEAATHAESKAENKYDTRGLEAAYLADGQRRRVHEIETALSCYRNLSPRAQQGEAIALGALIELELAGAMRWVFLGPDAAGLRVAAGQADVLVISPRSPLGQALLGLEEGDQVDVMVEGRRQHCSVATVL